jgi:hypothetical protein
VSSSNPSRPVGSVTNPYVLVIPPMRSPNTGRMLGWSMTHDPSCYVPAVRMAHHPWVQYQTFRVEDVPTHVGRCAVCGGGR